MSDLESDDYRIGVGIGSACISVLFLLMIYDGWYQKITGKRYLSPGGDWNLEDTSGDHCKGKSYFRGGGIALFWFLVTSHPKRIVVQLEAMIQELQFGEEQLL